MMNPSQLPLVTIKQNIVLFAKLQCKGYYKYYIKFLYKRVVEQNN